MVIQTGLKQSELGLIPEDWEVKYFGEVCVPSKTKLNPLVHLNMKCVELENISQDTGRLIGISDSTESVSMKSVFQQGDVLFGKLRPYLKKFLFADFEGICSTEIWVLKANSSILSKFLFYEVQSTRIINAANVSVGTKMPRAEWKTVSKTQILLPPIIHQKAIAEALSDMDALIAQNEKLLEKKKAIKQGVMQELLKPKEGWVTKKLGEMGICYRGVSYDPTSDLESSQSIRTYTLLRSTNIQKGQLSLNELQYVKKYKVRPFQVIKESDILICMANGSKQLVGKAALMKNVTSDLFTFGAFMGVFRVHPSVDPLFVFALMESESYRSYIDVLLSGSSINNLNGSSIESMEFKIPDEVGQKKISSVLESIIYEIDSLQAKLSKLYSQKQGMMQALLTGKIRLV